MSERVNLYDSRGLERLRRDLHFDARAIRRLRNDLLKRFYSDAAACRSFPVPELVELHALEIHERSDSAIDGATKLILRTSNGLLIESVILRAATGRTTVCLSSQVGCAAACDFCATGKMGIAKNLSAFEIVDQVVHAGQIVFGENRKIRNLVFMGMGEPFHNEENLYEAIETLTAAEFFHHSPTKILISSVGIPDAIRRFAQKFPTVHLALSLHSVRQDIRERLIPLAKKYPLDQLRRLIGDLNELSPSPVMIEYLLLQGLNDSLQDASELAAWLCNLNVHVNLIPLNPIADSPHLQSPSRPEREAFANQLKSAGLKTTIRYSLGTDIGAACGQLVRHENRQLATLQ